LSGPVEPQTALAPPERGRRTPAAPAASARGASAAAGAVDWHSLRGPVAGAAILAALLLVNFWHFLSAQFMWAVTNPADWGHTLVIPFIAGWFIYLGRERLAALMPFRTAWTGLVPVVVGLAIYMFCWLGPPTLRHHNLQGGGLSITLFGLVLLFFGWRAMAVLWFPLAYLCVFGQTISGKLMNYVTFPLQDLTSRGAYFALNLIGCDTDRTGNILTVWDNGVEKTLNIAEACSGMRMLMAFLALGVAMAWTGFGRFWQRALLIGLGVPIAILVNILRVVTLGLLSLYSTDFAAGEFHKLIGLLWLVPAFLMYLAVSWMLRQVLVEAPRPAGTVPAGDCPPPLMRSPADCGVIRFQPQARAALVVACLTLVAGGLGFRLAVAGAQAYLQKRPVPLRDVLDNIPRTLGPWRAGTEDFKLTDEEVESLGTPFTITRTYRNESAGSPVVVGVHIAYYTGMIDAVPHVADRCMVAQGWVPAGLPQNVDLPLDRSAWRTDTAGGEYPLLEFRHHITGLPVSVHMPPEPFQIRTTEFRLSKRPADRIFAGYFFIANGHTTPTPERVRMLAFDLQSRYAYYAKVQFTMSAAAETGPAEFAAIAAGLCDELLPQIMRCLPDWVEVRSRATGS
jgi:exosortase